MNKKAFVFSGQGSQSVGMGRDLYANNECARLVIDEISDIIKTNIAKLYIEGTQEELNKNAPICIFALDLAAYFALKNEGIAPDYVAGFSLGEYAALVASGALSLGQGTQIVLKRANIMAKYATGGMTAVIGVDAKAVEDACSQVNEGYVICVNYNCPGQTVVSGDSAGLEMLENNLKEKKIRFTRLNVAGGFHSALMDEAAKELNGELAKIDFKKPTVPVVLNINGDVYNQNDDLVQIMTNQCNHPVYWQRSVEKLISLGADAFVECGHGKVLSGFLKRIDKSVSNLMVSDIDSLNKTVNYFNS